MSNKQKQLSVFHAPLRPKDTEFQTEGCRHTNPSICKNNSLPEVCAFVREDGICMMPSKSWSKQYERLIKQT
jgi:hypothetical protein